MDQPARRKPKRPPQNCQRQAHGHGLSARAVHQLFERRDEKGRTMKNWLTRCCTALLMLFACAFVNAQNLSQGQKDVLDLLKRMYAVSPLTFEYAEFDGKHQP